MMLSDLAKDLRYALRSFVKNPGFTAVAVLVLGLGIGACTAIFSVVDAVLVRSLPWREPGRLTLVLESNASRGIDRMGCPPPDFREWKERNEVFETMAAFYGGSFNLATGGEPERVRGRYVSADYFHLLGVTPALGRSFLSDDETFGRHHVAMLSHALWRRRFGGDPAAVGRAVTLNDEPYTVVGIMPPGFMDPLPGSEIWVPMAFEPDSNWNTRNNYFLFALGRLKPGVTIDQARANMSLLAEDLQRRFKENAGVGASVVPLRDALVADYRPSLLMLSGAVGLVQLIACANVANLLLSRASTRGREMAIRAALGATGRRVARQLLTESLLLGCFGGVAGLLVAAWGTDWMAALGPADLRQFQAFSFDGRTLAFLLGASLLTAAVFGLAPALHTSRIDLAASLKSGGRGAAGGSGGRRIRNALVVCEVALSLVLLIGAGLLLRTLVRLGEVDPGFEPDGVLTAQIALPKTRYGDARRAAVFYRQVRDRLVALPGIQRAGFTSSLPLSASGGWGKYVTIEGRPAPSLEQVPSVQYRLVSGDYFQAMGIPLKKGRLFRDGDSSEGPAVALVNETFARRFFGGEDPLGRRISMDAPENLVPLESRPPDFRIVWRTVVGVIGDVKQLGLDQATPPEVYAPDDQNVDEPVPMFLAARAAADPSDLAAIVRNQVQAVDRDQPVAAVATMRELMDRSMSRPRFSAVLLALFAGVALTLALVGLYGVLSHAVSRRTHEIGIRMALGARRSDVMRMILGEGLRLTSTGLVVGVLGAAVLTRAVSGQLFGISAFDPLTFGLVPPLFVVVALVASYIPARRAIAVDPIGTLRNE